MMPTANRMRLWVQISFARCWMDSARLPCCWCRHDRLRIAALLAGSADRIAHEPDEPALAVAYHARRLFACAADPPCS